MTSIPKRKLLVKLSYRTRLCPAAYQRTITPSLHRGMQRISPSLFFRARRSPGSRSKSSSCKILFLSIPTIRWLVLHSSNTEENINSLAWRECMHPRCRYLVGAKLPQAGVLVPSTPLYMFSYLFGDTRCLHPHILCLAKDEVGFRFLAWPRHVEARLRFSLAFRSRCRGHRLFPSLKCRNPSINQLFPLQSASEGACLASA
jgi:hypothetical protein